MPRRGVSLLGAVLLVSGCGGDSGDSGEHAVQALASSTTASPAGTTQPASTELTITLANTEVPWHGEPPPLFDLVVADSEWGAGAEGDPWLATLRSGPGAAYDVAARITVPRFVIEGTGAVKYDVQGIGWSELDVGSERTAWVEADRLEVNETAQDDFYGVPCATEGATVGPAPITSASGSSDADQPADHVAQIWHWTGGPVCERLHIVLGTGWDYDSGGPLATGVPDGVTVEAFGSWARITVPGLLGARSDAVADQARDFTTIVARAADGTIVIDVYAPQPSLFAAQALGDPARLLVDVIPAPGDGSTPPAPVELLASPTSFVAWPRSVDSESPTEVVMPLTVQGYSRWFESTGSAEIQHTDGTASTATVTGPHVSNPGADTRWTLTATNWLEAWGTFEFTIDNIEPGEYRLLIGEYAPTGDGAFTGVTIPLRIPPPT